jgi:hypothetical protein
MRKGRLDKAETRYLLENYRIKSVSELAEHLDRDPTSIAMHIKKNCSGVMDYLAGTENMETKEKNEDFNKEFLKLVKSGVSPADAKRAISPDRYHGVKTIKDLEHLVKLIDSMSVYVDGVKESIENKIDYWRKAACQEAALEIAQERRELQIQKIALLQNVNNSKMPIPPTPNLTAEEIEYDGPGIYFAWKNTEIVYVGKANNIKKRMKAHHKVDGDMLVSYLKFGFSELYANECYYIWSCRPIMNGEIIKDSMFIKNDQNAFEEKLIKKTEEIRKVE